MSQMYGHGHIIVGLVAGKTEHHSLVSGSGVKLAVILSGLVFESLVNAHSYIGRLAVY